MEAGSAHHGSSSADAAAKLRRAVPADAASLAGLRLEFRGDRAPAVEIDAVFVARCEAWMRRRLTAESAWRAWIAEQAGQVAGTIWLQAIEKLPNPASESELHAYVSNFYVRVEHRNTGIGSALLRAALDECRRLDVDAVFLWPTARSRPLYERHGFAPGTGMLTMRG